MKRYFQSSISAVALGAMVMSGVVTTLGITAAPAFSKSDNANSNSNNDNRNDNSNRGGRDNSNGRGATASSLGALNAAHANAMALENASPDSRVGMIAIYKLAVEETAKASVEFDLAEAALGSFIEQCDLEAIEPLSVECQTILSNATELAGDTILEPYTHATYLASLNQAVDDAYDIKKAAKELEDKALEAAANKETSGEVIAALWDLLDI